MHVEAANYDLAVEGQAGVHEVGDVVVGHHVAFRGVIAQLLAER